MKNEVFCKKKRSFSDFTSRNTILKQPWLGHKFVEIDIEKRNPSSCTGQSDKKLVFAIYGDKKPLLYIGKVEKLSPWCRRTIVTIVLRHHGAISVNFIFNIFFTKFYIWFTWWFIRYPLWWPRNLPSCSWDDHYRLFTIDTTCNTLH